MIILIFLMNELYNWIILFPRWSTERKYFILYKLKRVWQIPPKFFWLNNYRIITLIITEEVSNYLLIIYIKPREIIEKYLNISKSRIWRVKIYFKIHVLYGGKFLFFFWAFKLRCTYLFRECKKWHQMGSNSIQMRP